MRISNLEYNIETKKVAFKICHISDIHYNKYYNSVNFNKIIENIKKVSPNYVCVTGDIIDCSNIADLNELYNFIKELSQICKVIMVLGNHDFDYVAFSEHIYCENKSYIESLKSIENVVLLRNEIYEDNNINFIGIELDYEYYLNKKYKYDENKINKILKKSNNNYNVFLLHNPEPIFDFKNLFLDNIDLILCGHTHGGLMPQFIKGHYGIISPRKKLFQKNMRGIYKIKNYVLIISSGITKLSKRSNLMFLNSLYSSNVNIIKVIKSKNTPENIKKS